MITLVRPTLSGLVATAVALTSGLTLCVPTALAAEGYGVTGTFGSSMSSVVDPQPLSNPDGVAVNQETGEVYVVDRGNNRVERFSSSGAYETQFNGSDNPSFPEGFASPNAIAVDNSCFYQGLTGTACEEADPSNGDAYVADTGHGVVDKLESVGRVQLRTVQPVPGIRGGFSGSRRRHQRQRLGLR